jgi:hypothetical protein
VNPLVSVRARFERFPASVKGAFILRGDDPDPHQVVLQGARVVQVGGAAGREMALIDTTLDIAPKQDVFVPFETSLAELEPGWYELECDLEVDGVQGTYEGGDRFVVPWPRASTRRGRVEVGKDLRLQAGRVRIEQIECAADSIRVHLWGPKSQPLAIRLEADGELLQQLELSHDDQTGRAKLVAYPLLKSHRALAIAVEAGKGDAGELEVKLP